MYLTSAMHGFHSLYSYLLQVFWALSSIGVSDPSAGQGYRRQFPPPIPTTQFLPAHWCAAWLQYFIDSKMIMIFIGLTRRKIADKSCNEQNALDKYLFRTIWEDFLELGAKISVFNDPNSRRRSWPRLNCSLQPVHML